MNNDIQNIEENLIKNFSADNIRTYSLKSKEDLYHEDFYYGKQIEKFKKGIIEAASQGYRVCVIKEEEVDIFHKDCVDFIFKWLREKGFSVQVNIYEYIKKQDEYDTEHKNEKHVYYYIYW